MCLLGRDIVVRRTAVRGVVKRWGNSAAVRIPAAVLEAAQEVRAKLTALIA